MSLTPTYDIDPKLFSEEILKSASNKYPEMYSQFKDEKRRLISKFMDSLGFTYKSYYFRSYRKRLPSNHLKILTQAGVKNTFTL